MLENNVAPHHHPLAVFVLQQIVDPAHVLGVDAAHANFRHQFLRRPGAQSKRLVATNVEPRQRQQRNDFAVEVVQQPVAILINRRKDAGRLAQRRILRVRKNAAKMAERLLAAEDVHACAAWHTAPGPSIPRA